MQIADFASVCLSALTQIAQMVLTSQMPLRPHSFHEKSLSFVWSTNYLHGLEMKVLNGEKVWVLSHLQLPTRAHNEGFKIKKKFGIIYPLPRLNCNVFKWRKKFYLIYQLPKLEIKMIREIKIKIDYILYKG